MDAEYGASLESLSREPRVEILRSGPGHTGPYVWWTWACVVVWRDAVTVECLASKFAPTAAERRPAERLLHRAGVRTAIWERVRRGGTVHRVTVVVHGECDDGRRLTDQSR